MIRRTYLGDVVRYAEICERAARAAFFAAEAGHERAAALERYRAEDYAMLAVRRVLNGEIHLAQRQGRGLAAERLKNTLRRKVERDRASVKVRHALHAASQAAR